MFFMPQRYRRKQIPIVACERFSRAAIEVILAPSLERGAGCGHRMKKPEDENTPTTGASRYRRRNHFRNLGGAKGHRFVTQALHVLACTNTNEVQS
jgi:hypothetical protein